MAGSYASREGAQNDYHDGRGRLVSHEDLVREPLSRGRQRQPGGLRGLALLGMVGLLGLSGAMPASAQDVRCSDYGSLDQMQRAYLAYGYLEGVQGALDKERTDVLVPPSDPRHPIWWVLPSDLADKPFIGLAEKVNAYCQVPDNQRESLLRAFLAQSVQHNGSPWLGASTIKKESGSWKNFLGGKETSLSCPDYLATPEATRQAIVYGYYLGTEALRIRLGRSASTETVWPSPLGPQDVRLDVDRRCQQDKGGTVREMLSVSTTELTGRKP
jgi:hypothetical protein